MCEIQPIHIHTLKNYIIRMADQDTKDKDRGNIVEKLIDEPWRM
jgi:hypothetical protein